MLYRVINKTLLYNKIKIRYTRKNNKERRRKMYTEKQKVLQETEKFLNKQEQPWKVIVEGDSIIATWKWMDATFFSEREVSDEEKEYKFIVTLKDNGKWKETDQSKEKTSNIDFKDGKISFGTSSFIGNSTQKSFTIGLGKNKDTGETGIIKFKFDTKIMKEPIRQYLASNGWKKAGLFG